MLGRAAACAGRAGIGDIAPHVPGIIASKLKGEAAAVRDAAAIDSSRPDRHLLLHPSSGSHEAAARSVVARCLLPQVPHSSINLLSLVYHHNATEVDARVGVQKQGREPATRSQACVSGGSRVSLGWSGAPRGHRPGDLKPHNP